MNRRELIKISAILASGTILGNKVFPHVLDSSLSKIKDLSSSQDKRFGDGRDWFFKNRFGMFVHWGLYAIPAWHEQIQQKQDILRKKYGQYVNQWNPKDFDPEKWLDLLQEAGMKYLTFTTKHHDGFCLWDTKETSFNTMNTPYKKDIVGMLTDACHKRDIPISFYYSIVDWHHKNYPNQGRHHELPNPESGDNPNWELYMDFLKKQVKELCSNYGEIHGFWWDMNVPEYQDTSINAMIRKLQPKAIINNRGFDEGDFGTPERDYDQKLANSAGFSRPTEACQSVGMQSWGYRKEEDYYSDRYLIKSIDSYLSRDANYLLNVGPDASGKIPEVSQKILQRIGKWYFSVKESYENVKPVINLISNKNILLTYRDTTLYVHLNKVPFGNSVNMKPINLMPKQAILLNNEQPVEFIVERVPYEKEPFLILRNIPVNKFANNILVIKLEFDKRISKIVEL